MRKANRILVIDNRDSFVYNIVEYLRRISGVEVDVVREGQGLSQGLSQEKDDIAGIVLSPGAGIPQEYRLMTALLKDPRTAGIPVLGVCLGMQAGRDEDGNIMVIVHRSRPWTGVQFHPESIITGYGFRMICNWVNGCTRV